MNVIVGVNQMPSEENIGHIKESMFLNGGYATVDYVEKAVTLHNIDPQMGAYGFQRLISPLRKYLSIIRSLLLEGAEVRQKTGKDTVNIQYKTSDDYYAMAFGYTITEEGRNIWDYICGTSPFTLGDVINFNGKVYVIGSLISVPSCDYYGIGNSIPLKVARLIPFSNEAVANAASCIDRLAPKSTLSWTRDYWKYYFKEVLLVSEVGVIAIEELTGATVIGNINYDTMCRILELQNTRYTV